MMYFMLLLIAVVLYFAIKFIAISIIEADGGNKAHKSFINTIALLVSIAMIVIATISFSLYQIPAGHIGVVYEFGAIKGQITEGLQFVLPYKKVVIANIQVQRHVFEKLESFSIETQTVFVKASLNVKVSPEAIQELYRTVGIKWFETLVEPRVAQNFKDEIVKYKSVDIAPNREVIRHTVSEKLKGELSSYSITVVDLLLDNIDFSEAFETSIEAKQIASQRALEEEQKIKVVKNQADQAVEKAKGEGNAILSIAEKQAEANKKLSESLTPELVQYSLIQKLGDKIEVMILPAGQNFILDSSMLRKEK